MGGPPRRPAPTRPLSDPGAGGNPRGGGLEAFAARRMRWQELAGIHDAVGIEDAPEARHEAQIGLAELERHARGLVESYTVLAGDAAAHGDARAKELVVGQLGPLALGRLDA